MGRDSSAKGNWMDGRPVRILAFPIPKDPIKGPWVPKVLSEELHVVHNFTLVTFKGVSNLLTASYEGVTFIDPAPFNGKTFHKHYGDGHQANPKGPRGASEVANGTVRPPDPLIATIEPWHGNQVVIYHTPTGRETWDRQVIDEQLRWGHAIKFVDLDGDKADELVVGVRDNPAKGDTFTEKCGVRIYKPTDGVGKKWARNIIDDGGIAVEDLTVADLNGDGKPDIIAVGRGTHNARIYWNQGK